MSAFCPEKQQRRQEAFSLFLSPRKETGSLYLLHQVCVAADQLGVSLLQLGEAMLGRMGSRCRRQPQDQSRVKLLSSSGGEGGGESLHSLSASFKPI